MKSYFLISFLSVIFLANGQESQLIGVVRTNVINQSQNPFLSFGGSIQIGTYNTTSSRFSKIYSALPYQFISVNGGYAYDESSNQYYCLLSTLQQPNVFEICSINASTGLVEKKFPISSNSIYDFITVNSDKQELYCLRRNRNASTAYTFLKINLKTGDLTQVGDGNLSLFTNISGRAILQKETNRYFFANNSTIAYINANTGVLEKSADLNLPNNLYGIYNLALDNATNTIYGLSKQGPNGVNFYLIGINASTLQVTYVGNKSVSNVVNVGSSTFNPFSKTYIFSVPNKILEVNVKTGVLVKEHNLIGTNSNGSTIQQLFDFYAFKTNAIVAPQNITSLNVSIHPNPTIGTTGFNVTILQFTKPMECMLLDSYGKVIHNFIMKQKTQKIEVGNLKPGTYFIKTEKETARILIQ